MPATALNPLAITAPDAVAQPAAHTSTTSGTATAAIARSHVAPLAFTLTPGGDARGLSRAQRAGVTAAIVGVHLAAVVALMQVREVRDTVREAAPLFVDWIAPPTVTPDPPPPAPPRPRAAVQPIPRSAPVTDLVTAAPSPAPSSFAAAPPEAPVAAPEPVAVAAPPAPAPAPAPVAAPKVIPASAVEYLEKPEVAYPRQSIRNHETGTVEVRVFIDSAGLPKLVQVNRSSGHARLDDAAVAGVQRSRFKPYTENGRPTEGWALIPFPFELEKSP